MTDRWLNLGYEDNILQPYVEPPPNYNDPVRLGELFYFTVDILLTVSFASLST